MPKKAAMAKKAAATQLPAVIKTDNDFAAILQSVKANVGTRLPGGITTEWFLAQCWDGYKRAKQGVESKGRKFEPTRHSVEIAVLTAASCGISPNSAMNSACFVLYGQELVFQLQYNGLRDMALRTNEVLTIDVQLVYEGERCEIEFGDDPSVKHEVDLAKRTSYKDVIGAYMVAQLKNGRRKVEAMPRFEIDKAKEACKNTSQSGPWYMWFGEMGRKACLKRGLKHVPMSAEDRRQIGEAEKADALAEKYSDAITLPKQDFVAEMEIQPEGLPAGHEETPEETAKKEPPSEPENTEHPTGAGTPFDVILCTDLQCENVRVDPEDGTIYPGATNWCGSAKKCLMVQQRNKKNPEASND